MSDDYTEEAWPEDGSDGSVRERLAGLGSRARAAYNSDRAQKARKKAKRAGVEVARAAAEASEPSDDPDRERGMGSPGFGISPGYSDNEPSMTGFSGPRDQGPDGDREPEFGFSGSEMGVALGEDEMGLGFGSDDEDDDEYRYTGGIP